MASLLSCKYPFGLKLLSTPWNPIISSDPELALTTHSNSFSNHFLRQYKPGFFSLEKFQGGELKSEDTSFAGPEGCDIVLCHCNGVLLLADSCYRPTKYVLWNPSIGKKLDFHFPRQLYYDASYGICYDTVEHDFKVVYSSGAEYGVFSFNKNSWTQKTGLKYRGTAPGLYVDGILYWDWRDEKTTHVVYFDSRSDELKRLEKPKGLADDDRLLCLACLNGDLYLYCNTGDGTTVQMWVKEKGIFENCWKQFVTIEKVETRIYSFKPLCFMGGKMVVELEGERYVMYRFDDKTFEDVEDFLEWRFSCCHLIPYQESSLFPSLINHPLEEQGILKTEFFVRSK